MGHAQGHESCRQNYEAEAFALYERNWRFVEVDGLVHHEAALIVRLTLQYGNGVLNVSSNNWRTLICTPVKAP